MAGSSFYCENTNQKLSASLYYNKELFLFMSFQISLSTWGSDHYVRKWNWLKTRFKQLLLTLQPMMLIIVTAIICKRKSHYAPFTFLLIIFPHHGSQKCQCVHSSFPCCLQAKCTIVNLFNCNISGKISSNKQQWHVWSDHTFLYLFFLLISCLRHDNMNWPMAFVLCIIISLSSFLPLLTPIFFF